MSNEIVPAMSTEGWRKAESRALTDDELNVVAGGAKNDDNPFVEAVMNAFNDTIGSVVRHYSCKRSP